MNRLDDALNTVQRMEHGKRELPFSCVHPLALFLTAAVFLVLLTSIPKNRLDLVLAMGVWVYLYALLGKMSIGEILKKLWALFALLFLVGIANPFLDRKVLFSLGTIPITSGMISMLVLFLKGALALIFASFLASSAGMAGILSALSMLHLPPVLINVIYLIYRYLSLMLREASLVWTAYRLRAPGQKGIHFGTWGSLVGMMLIRSMDRAARLYQSMELRGYRPQTAFVTRGRFDQKSLLYLAVCLATLLLVRFVPVFSFIGSFMVD
ncbi:MAG: hypothetical protein J6P72_02765 [Firmicutes bacterium]|nr:hypothetical protein [Bacillota bacterium]